MTTVGLYSDAAVVGGAEISMMNLAAAQDRKTSIIVCSPDKALLTKAARTPGVRTVLLSVRARGIGAVLDHRREFRKLRIDLLQVNLANPFTSRAALLGGILAGIPTVSVEHLVFASRRRRGAVTKRLLSALQAMTIAVGNASADDLVRLFGIPRRRIAVVHNGVPDRPVSHRPSYEIPVIGCVARLEEQKGVDLLLEAIARIADVRLVIVGDGTQRPALERQAAALQITHRVDFAGWVDNAAERIGGFDIFALASRNESFPLTIVEAMLAGTPVVATDVGSVAEAVRDGQTGLLVAPEDVDAFTNALRRLLGSAAFRAELAVAARIVALDHFTDDAMYQAYRGVWQDVLDSTRTCNPRRMRFRRR